MYIGHIIRSERPRSVRALVLSIACLPFTLVWYAGREAEFERTMKGVKQRRKPTPMIGFPKYWSRLTKLSERIDLRLMAAQGSYGGMHSDKACQMGWPCISFFGNSNPRRDNGWRHNLVRRTCRIFTVELLHHIFSRMDKTDKIDMGWERIHGSAPTPKAIMPGPPYSQVMKKRR